MAQKQKLRPSPLDEPPTASSSDSEEEEDQHQQSSQQHHEEEQELSSGEDEEEASSEEEEDEDEDLPPPISKNPPPPSSNPHSHPLSSESESGSETESEPTPAKVKPLASKPMDKAQKPKAQSSPAPPKSAPKRPAESSNAHVTDPKRAKKKAVDSSSSAPAAVASDDEMEDDGKKSGDQLKKARLWSEDDEVAVLKGLIEYASKTGQDPLKLPNATGFYDFMKKSLHVEVSCNQLKEKVRRLKKKYETLAGKMENGECPKFLKQHDQKAFELSQKVWGGELAGVGANGSVEKPKSNGSAARSPKKKETTSRNVASAKKPKPETKLEPVSVSAVSLELKESDKKLIDQKPDGDDANLFLRELSRYNQGTSVCQLDADDVQRGLELIGESKRAELRGKWKKLHHAEMELFANRSELIGEQTKLIVEALRSSNH